LNYSVGTTAEHRDATEIKAFFGTIVARRWIVIGTLVVFIIATALITMTTPKRYSTQAKLLTGQATGGGSGGGGGVNTPVLDALIAANGQSPETYADLLEQTPIAQRVRDDLGLKVSAETLLAHLAVKPLTNTSIITVTVDWADAQTAAAIANEFVRVFVKRERELISSQAVSTLDFLNKELPNARERMHRTNAILARYSASHRIVDISTQTQNLIAQAAGADAKIAQSQLELKHFRAQLQDDRQQLRAYKPSDNGGRTTNENPVVAQLSGQLESVNLQLATMRRQFTDSYAGVKTLEAQRAQIMADIAKLPPRVVSSENIVPNPAYQQLQSQIIGLLAQIAAGEAELVELRQQRAALEPRIINLPTETARIADLQHEAKAAQDVYNALQQKYEEAAVVRTTAPSDVQITQPADPARASVSPNFRLNMTIGTIIGLVVALGAAFLTNFFDNTVKSEHDVSGRLQLPTLGSIPVIARNDSRGDSYLRIRNITIEAFLQLATSLRYSSDGPLRSITFTSPAVGDGKSTIALNAAIAMGELEPPVLIVDADLRASTLHKRLRTRNVAGLSDLLVGRLTFDDIIQQTAYSGVHFVSSGTRAPNPVKLLRSKRMDAFLTEAARRYTCVIVDAPPTDLFIDAAVLAGKTDGSVLVVSTNQTDIPSAVKSLALLQRFGVKNVLGVVLNRVKPSTLPQTAYQLQSGAADVALTADEEATIP
jgi:succinoglycan biosynthesis transport protein ExoP